MLMVQCLVIERMVCLSLVSALCNFGERIGSQYYIHVHNIVTSFDYI